MHAACASTSDQGSSGSERKPSHKQDLHQRLLAKNDKSDDTILRAHAACLRHVAARLKDFWIRKIESMADGRQRLGRVFRVHCWLQGLGLSDRVLGDSQDDLRTAAAPPPEEEQPK